MLAPLYLLLFEEEATAQSPGCTEQNPKGREEQSPRAEDQGHNAAGDTKTTREAP